MRCQTCGNIDTEVKDSRPDGPLDTIRRRRYCNCGARFTTYEVYAEDFSRIREDRTDHVLRAAKKMQDEIARTASKIVKNLERDMRR